MDKRITFTIREIAAASGTAVKTLETRYRTRSRSGLLPQNLTEFNYEQVKILLTNGRRKSRVTDQAKVRALRQQLDTDGFNLKKEATA